MIGGGQSPPLPPGADMRRETGMQCLSNTLCVRCLRLTDRRAASSSSSTGRTSLGSALHDLLYDVASRSQVTPFSHSVIIVSVQGMHNACVRTHRRRKG